MVLRKKGEPVRSAPMDPEEWSKGHSLLDNLEKTLKTHEFTIVIFCHVRQSFAAYQRNCAVLAL